MPLPSQHRYSIAWNPRSSTTYFGIKVTCSQSMRLAASGTKNMHHGSPGDERSEVGTLNTDASSRLFGNLFNSHSDAEG